MAASLNTAPLELTAQAYADAFMLASGGYAPLTGFMNGEQYLSTLRRARLPDGQPWGLPIVLPVAPDFQHQGIVALRWQGQTVGQLEVESHFALTPDDEAALVYGTTSTQHPSVAQLAHRPRMALAGKVTWLGEQPHSPTQVRAEIATLGWHTVAGFQTRNALHLGHEKLLSHALSTTDGLLLHPLTGPTKADDLSVDARWLSYQETVSHLPAGRVLLRPYPAAMRYAGPREALTHALSRRNYGVTHFLIGRDHAGVGNFYAPDAAQKFLASFGDELGVCLLPLPEVAFCPVCGVARLRGECAHGSQLTPISASAVRALLQQGQPVPASLMRPEAAQQITAQQMMAQQMTNVAQQPTQAAMLKTHTPQHTTPQHHLEEHP